MKYNDPTGHYSSGELMQHFGCEDWQCVEWQFDSQNYGSAYRDHGGWLQVLLDAVDGDKITAWNPAQHQTMSGQFLRNADTGQIGIQMVLSNGQLTGAIPESAFAAYGAVNPYTGGQRYALQSAKYSHRVGQLYSLPGSCSLWDCTAIGLDIAAISGDGLRSGSLACAWAAPGCYMAGQAMSVGATVYGLGRTEVAHASGDASDADLAVNRATAIMGFRGQAPIFTSVGGLVQLVWDFLDPFHPW